MPLDTAQPKPPKGSGRIARIERGKAIATREDREKTKVRKRDRTCRWPHQDDDAIDLCRRFRREVAHLDTKGMGGDHGHRTEAKRMILCCFPSHQGAHSLHQKTLRVKYLTKDLADGPLRFEERDSVKSPWRVVGIERSVGILE